MVTCKRGLDTLYTGFCDIYEYVKVKDDFTKVISTTLTLLYENIPCRASYYNNSSNISSVKDQQFNSIKKQTIKLFFPNQFSVPAGSIFEVTQNGKFTKYKNSGEPALYSSHQEVMLELFDDIT